MELAHVNFARRRAPLDQDPGDGSNAPNVLTQSGIVRRNVRSSFGGASGTTGGVLVNGLAVALAVPVG